MNLPQFLKLIDNTTSKMTKKELEECIHKFARTLPEEQRDWFVSMISGKASKTKDSEQNVSHELYNQLESIISGEYRLDSEYNEMWDEWYNDEGSEFVFEDNNGLFPIIEEACTELHRFIDSAEYNDAYRLGQLLLSLEVQVDGDYSDYDENTLDLDDLECYGLVSFSVKDVLLDIACAVYFTYSGQERTAELYRVGTRFDNFRNWTLEELLQHAPEELPDFDAFLKEWIFYLQTIEELTADEYLEEALEMQTDPISALETARQSVKTHPELYLKVLSMQDNDKSRLEIGLEALKSIDPNYIIRSEIALQTAEAAIRLNDHECAISCRTESFRSNSTAVNFLRALVNHPDYANALLELTSIASEYRVQQQKSFHRQNMLDDDTRRFIRFLSGEFQNAYADLLGKYNSYTPETLHIGIALTALFLYPEQSLREGGKAMLSTVEAGLKFKNDEYLRGIDISKASNNSDILWNCLKKCRSQTPLLDHENALDILQKHCVEYTEYVMNRNLRGEYSKCAEYTALLGEILEADGKISSKNDYMLKWKEKYNRRTAYHRELRACGMVDGKR